MTCATNKPNTGTNSCTEVQMGKIVNVILSPKQLEFATTGAITENAMIALIKAENKLERAYPLPMPFLVELANDEPIMETGSLGQQTQVRHNAGIDKFSIKDLPAKFGSYLYKAWNNKTVYAYYITDQNYIVGQTDEATELKVIMVPVYVSVTFTKAMDDSTDKVVFSIQKTDVEKANTYAIAYQPAFNLKALKGLQYVVITATGGAHDLASSTVTIKTLYEGTHISGIAKADLTFTKLGVAESISTFVEDESAETYTLTPTTALGAGTYVLNLVDPAIIADADLFIESNGSVSIVVT